MKRPLVLWLCCCSVLTLVGTKAFGLAESTGADGSNAQAVHVLGQKGEGIRIGLIAGRNVYADHEAFFDKDPCGAPTGSTHAFNYDFTEIAGIDPFDHDTWMAGIAASRGGVSYPDYNGVAPGAEVHCGRIADDSNAVATVWIQNALTNLIDVQGCRVIMTGTSFGGDPNGQSLLTMIYDYYACSRDVVFAIGAGNGYSVLQIFGDAYNGITTGGAVASGDDVYDRVGNISSSGPTWDGRRKPDVVAPTNMQTVPHIGPGMWYTPPWNDGRTSLSGPHTAGIAALLLGLAGQTADANDDHSEVIKAVIVNTTFPNIKDKSGVFTNPQDSNNTWHQDRGYGRVDALRAYNVLAAGQILKDTIVFVDKGWAFGSLAPTEQHNYVIDIPKNHRLVATLNWNRRVEWDDDKPRGVINEGELNPYLADLDMELFAPNDTNAIFNESIGGLSPSDNLEKCDLLITSTGDYTVRIINNSTNGESAEYGFAFELIPPLVADFNLDYVVDVNDLSVLAEDWLESNTRADATGEGDVNFRDFAVFAANRGSFNPLYH